MASLPSPVGVFTAARTFFTPPTVTPVDSPASWFAAQRSSGADAAPRQHRPVSPVASGIEAFELDADADLDAGADAFDRRESVGLPRAARDGRPAEGATEGVAA